MQTKLKPGLGAFYAILPVNGSGLIYNCLGDAQSSLFSFGVRRLLKLINRLQPINEVD